MASLSNCIFEWDKEDFDRLMSAKRSELVKSGIQNPTEKAIKLAISKTELASHCKRQTRGAEQTKEKIEALLLCMLNATDTLGVPICSEQMKDIWEEQQRHLQCIQDVEGVQLYTLTGSVKKGNVELPVYRCARGSTSLESFHLHLARFIPGSVASSVNFQAYLLDGLMRWNTSRAAEATGSETIGIRTFNNRLQEMLNKYSKLVRGTSILPQYQPPRQYTGEKIGVEYLYSQTGQVLPQNDLLEDIVDNEVDKLEDTDFKEEATLEVLLEGDVALPEDEDDTQAADVLQVNI